MLASLASSNSSELPREGKTWRVLFFVFLFFFQALACITAAVIPLATAHKQNGGQNQPKVVNKEVKTNKRLEADTLWGETQWIPPWEIHHLKTCDWLLTNRTCPFLDSLPYMTSLMGHHFHDYLSYLTGEEHSPAILEESNSHVVNCLWRGPQSRGQ